MPYANFATIFFFRLLFPYLFTSILFSCSFCGCASYKIPTEYFLENNCCESYSTKEINENTPPHWLYRIVPRHRSQLQWYDIGHMATWMVFGNDDDGIFGEAQPKPYRPNEKPSLQKSLRWWCRNPLHNFCFYTIGSAHRRNSEIDILQIVDNKISGLHYRADGSKLFIGKNSSLYIALHGGKPFLSLRLRYHRHYRADFYIGWRERGNFGIKFLPFCHIRACRQIANYPDSSSFQAG